MPRLTAFSVAALVLTAACTKPQQIATATPRDELPPLILPESIRLAAGATRSGGSGGAGLVAGFNGDEEPRPSRSDWGAAAEEPAPRPSGGDRAAPAALVSASPQPTAYALIVGIERYRDVVAATGARSDAERFAELARVTLGVPEDNIKLLLDDRASRTDIAKQIRWLQANVPSGARVYFFFSGHGAPEPASGESYVVPYDGDPQYLKDTAIPMKDVLADLEKTRAKDVLALADSCFSGAGGRSVLAPGTRPLVRVEEPKPQTRVALLSASSGAEISGPAEDGSGGLFSKYVIEALGSGQGDLDGDGQISLRELADWVGPRVTREAKRANREQTPHLMLGKKLGSPAEFIVSWGYAR